MAKAKTKAPEQTLEEARYLKRLVEQRASIVVRLSTDEEFEGVLEFFDDSFLRITRAGEPNLFIYKHDIKYLYEA